MVEGFEHCPRLDDFARDHGPRCARGNALWLLLPSTSPKTLAFNSSQKFRHSRYPHTPILVREIVFEALLRFACATTCCLACPPCRSRPDSPPAHEDVYFRASDGLVTRSIAGYHYSANWEPCAGGTSTRWIIN